MLRNQRAYQLIYDWTKNRCAAAVGAWGGRMVGRAAVGLLGCLKKERMSEAALLQAAEMAKKSYLRPAADTDLESTGKQCRGKRSLRTGNAAEVSGSRRDPERDQEPI